MTAGRSAGKSRAAQAADRPIARVAVDVPLPHLDRPFDYLVPESMAGLAVPGCRVRVRFSGRLTGGYLLDRTSSTEHPGRLAFLDRVVSPEPVLTADIAGLARAVADRYGGTLADVLRLAIPPRHAAAEAAASAGQDATAGDRGGPGAIPATAAGAGPWARYPAGQSYLAALADGRAPRAVWSALPGPSWPEEIALAVAAVAAAGRGALIVVPDARDLCRVDTAIAAELGHGRHVALSAQLGPAERYRRWLAVARRQIKIVAGTRSAMFAPVAELGLVVIWDDGDDLHAELRAPYPHARDVLLLRAHRSGAAALLGGFARTAETAQLISIGWARALVADQRTVRQHAPLVLAAGEDAELARDEAARTARMPSLALRSAREALATGPVLFQVPRRGYLVAVACQRCHTRVRCGTCAGPVGLAGPDQPLRCSWCGCGRRPQLRGLREQRAADAGHRGPPDRRGTRPGVPFGAGAHLKRDRCPFAGASLPGDRRRHARGRAASGWRLSRRGPARWLGAARPGQPERGAGGAQALDERRRAGPPLARRREGDRHG